MPKKRKISVEIVRQPEPEDGKAILDRLIKEKVEQILAERDLEQAAPVYRSRRIRPIHPGFERDKHALYFEKWGCMACGRKRKVTHLCNAQCGQCHNRYTLRMAALEREWVSQNPESQILEDIDRLTSRSRTARALLGEGE